MHLVGGCMKLRLECSLLLAAVACAACAACADLPPASSGTGRGPDAPSRDAAVSDVIVAVREPIDLGNLTTQPGTLGSMAWDVNATGWVVGEAHTAMGATRAFVWKPGSGMENLGTLRPTDTFSRAEAINDAGWVVGIAGSTST